MSELVRYKRLLKLDIPQGQSAFFWGARKTGKSTYLETNFPDSIYYDLLKSDLFIRLSKQPHLLREEILALTDKELQHPIIMDEVQKIPLLLNEIHWLIEHTTAYFILCSSSARKLKRDAESLLGGRAWTYMLYPLVYPEIPDFDLLKALNRGLIPSHYLAFNPHKTLKSYINDYLTQEILAEGLTRNLPAFARFLDTVTFNNGELTNFNNIARECFIDSKTVKEYYYILVDTLLGYFIPPFTKKIKRETIHATAKFYLFDVGVAGALIKRDIKELKGTEAGRAFEHFILMELIAYRSITDQDFAIEFWRTKTGLEVDFILNRGEVAIEVKISGHVSKQDLRGLIAFQEEHKPKKAYVVSLSQRKRKIDEIWILPYQTFLKMLWNKEII